MLPMLVSAQDDAPYKFKDFDYKTHIKSVKFHPVGKDLDFPLIYLNSGDYFTMRFDDLEGDSKNYMYKVILCNQDWTPSDLSYFDYINGLEEENIQDYEFSYGTFLKYTNYTFDFPNEDMAVTKAGNYLMVVFDDDKDDEESIIITRRFVVVDPVVQVLPNMTMPGSPSKFQTHQELDFNVNYEGIGIKNPMRTVSATIVQNNRWNSAITELPPFLINRNNHLSFDYSNKVSFPGHKEWRYAPLRSVEYPPANDIAQCKRYEDGWYLTLKKDVMLGDVSYAQFVDLNGGFVIENRDGLNGDSDISGDYLNVLFSLSTHNLEYSDKNVFLFGEFTNWEIKPEFKCQYNEEVGGYVTKQRLKQGFYNYAYAVYDPKTKEIDFTETEGNYRLTENEYTILIYHRPFGQRYDSVIGAVRFKNIEPGKNLLDED